MGNISGTERALDMAIDGNGYFILDDNGSVSYTRAGMFSLDKDGYVVANNGSRLQGYAANGNGVVNGVLDDLQIQVSNQPPRLTNMVSSILNLDASQLVLQEQGLQLVSNGLVVGAADSGILNSTTTVLSAVGQPTTPVIPAGSTPAQVITAIQQAFDSTLGSQQLTASIGGAGQLVVERAGYAATDGSSFTVANTATWDALFGAAGAVTAGTPC